MRRIERMAVVFALLAVGCAVALLLFSCAARTKAIFPDPETVAPSPTGGVSWSGTDTDPTGNPATPREDQADAWKHLTLLENTALNDFSTTCKSTHLDDFNPQAPPELCSLVESYERSIQTCVLLNRAEVSQCLEGQDGFAALVGHLRKLSVHPLSPHERGNQ